jgi:predicted GNAT superfamily acetyltransferase
MSIVIKPLSTPKEFLACQELQADSCDGLPFLTVQALVAVKQGNGLILGAIDDREEMQGAIIDVAWEDRKLPSLFTAFRAVRAGKRNMGIGTKLRYHERDLAVERGTLLARWPIDPLRGLESHVAFNKLGAIAVGYERDVYGELHDSRNDGLATDRLIVEWWLTSPRVQAVVDSQHLPYHFHLGLDKMEVATRTVLTDDGYRRLVKFDDYVCNGITRSSAVLVEIPAKLDSVRSDNLGLARDWRLKTRDIFERMFSAGYMITGLVHEGGRSFQLCERESKSTILERSS